MATAKAELSRQRVILLRTAEQSKELRQLLEGHGANVIVCPMIQLIPDEKLLKTIDARFLKEFNLLIFTSANGVRIFMEEILKKGLEIKDKRVWCVGPKTKEKCLEYGLKVDAMPKKFVSESILELLPQDGHELRVLIPTAQGARTALSEELERRVAKVTVLPIYQNVQPEIRELDLEKDDFVVFTSSSTADHFFSCSFPHQTEITAFCIGEITAGTVKNYLKKNVYISKEATSESLVECMLETKNLRG